MRARAGNIGDALREQTARAALRHGERRVFLLQELQHALFERGAVDAVNEIAHLIADILDHRLHERFAFLLVRALGGDAHPAFALAGVRRDGGVRPVHKGAQARFHRALADAEKADHVRAYHGAGELLEIRHHIVPQHRDALSRRTGQHHDAHGAVLDDASRRGAAVVRQHDAPLGEICLLEVVVGKAPAALGKVFADIRERVLIEIELPVKGARERLLGEIVARGAETAGRDDEIGAVPRAVKALGEPGGVVADDGVPVYVHAQLRQRERNVPRVGVDRAAEQKLRPDGEDFGVHRSLLTSENQGSKRTRSMPAIASATRPSISSTASASSTASMRGRVRGWRGVNTVQQSS